MRNPLNRSVEVNPGFHQSQEGLRKITRGILAACLAHDDLQNTRNIIAASPNVISLNEHRNALIDSIVAVNDVDALAYLALADEIASYRTTIHLIPVVPVSFMAIYDQDAEIG